MTELSRKEEPCSMSRAEIELRKRVAHCTTFCAAPRSASESAMKLRMLSAIQAGIQSGNSIAAPLCATC